MRDTTLASPLTTDSNNNLHAVANNRSSTRVQGSLEDQK